MDAAVVNDDNVAHGQPQQHVLVDFMQQELELAILAVAALDAA